MKIRLIGTEAEIQDAWAKLAPHRYKFTSWKNPQSGRNPKYAESKKMLCYLEIEIEDFLEIIKDGKNIYDPLNYD